jgi:hypothetical protein
MRWRPRFFVISDSNAEAQVLLCRRLEDSSQSDSVGARIFPHIFSSKTDSHGDPSTRPYFKCEYTIRRGDEQVTIRQLMVYMASKEGVPSLKGLPPMVQETRALGRFKERLALIPLESYSLSAPASGKQNRPRMIHIRIPPVFDKDAVGVICADALNDGPTSSARPSKGRMQGPTWRHTVERFIAIPERVHERVVHILDFDDASCVDPTKHRLFFNEHSKSLFKEATSTNYSGWHVQYDEQSQKVGERVEHQNATSLLSAFSAFLEKCHARDEDFQLCREKLTPRSVCPYSSSMAYQPRIVMYRAQDVLRLTNGLPDKLLNHVIIKGTCFEFGSRVLIEPDMLRISDNLQGTLCRLLLNDIPLPCVIKGFVNVKVWSDGQASSEVLVLKAKAQVELPPQAPFLPATKHLEVSLGNKWKLVKDKDWPEQVSRWMQFQDRKASITFKIDGRDRPVAASDVTVVTAGERFEARCGLNSNKDIEWNFCFAISKNRIVEKPVEIDMHVSDARGRAKAGEFLELAPLQTAGDFDFEAKARLGCKLTESRRRIKVLAAAPATVRFATSKVYSNGILS